MSVHRKFLAFAAVLALSGSAAAQAPDDLEPSPDAAAAWGAYPNERHLLLRVQGGVGARLNDAWGAGTLAPPFLLVQGSYLLANAGPLRMGPSLGGQIGFDLGHSGLQGTVQPGWAFLLRPSPALGVTFRLDVPLLITRGRCDPQEVPLPAGRPGSPVHAPISGCTALGFGVEAGAGAAYYLTAGVALTAEASFSMYFGDSFYFYPVVGAGLGVLIDYEILP